MPELRSNNSSMAASLLLCSQQLRSSFLAGEVWCAELAATPRSRTKLQIRRRRCQTVGRQAHECIGERFQNAPPSPKSGLTLCGWGVEEG
mmetsp:Transcript_33139/g.98611  ORF Transcript_33139/g.98611 Transcript_33139/m.98611 type:complete len:90 (+) Transcript_33139:341-610(+)